MPGKIDCPAFAMKGEMLSDEVARKLAAVDLNDPEQVNVFMRFLSTKRASTADKVFEGYLAARLSNPSLFARKFTTDALMAAVEPFRLAVSGGVDAIRARVTKTPQERFAGEATRFLAGAFGGSQEAFRNFVYTLKMGMGAEAASAFENPTRGPAIGGRAGYIVRTPLRLIQAINEFSAAFDKRGSLYSEAYRTARMEGLTADALAARTAELIHTPTIEIIDAAHAAEQRMTFQRELGAVGQRLLAVRQTTPLLKWLFPIAKTPANIAKTAAVYTPFNLARLAYREAIGTGLRGAELSDNLATSAIGSMLGAGIYSYVASGNVTGQGPIDKGQHAVWAQSHEPYSIKVAGHWLSYEHLKPLAAVVGMAADLSDNMENMTEEETSKRIQQFALSVGKTLTDNTFAGQLREMLDAIHQPGDTGTNVAKSLAGGLVPGIVAGPAKAFDDTRRDARTPLDAIQAGIPGLRQGLPPQVDYRGQEKPAPGSGPINRLISPVAATPVRGDEIDRAFESLKGSAAALPRSVLVQGRRVQLTAKEYARYAKTAGEAVTERLQDIDLTDEPDAVRKQLQHAVQEGHNQARREFLEELMDSQDFNARLAASHAKIGAKPLE